MQIGCKEIIHAVRIGQLYDKESRMLDLEKLEGLVKIMEGSTLNTMSIKDGDFKIMMSKLDNPPVIAGSGVVSSISAVSSDSSASNSSTDTAEEENEVHITSPIVGTFYSAKGPTVNSVSKKLRIPFLENTSSSGPITTRIFTLSSSYSFRGSVLERKLGR